MFSILESCRLLSNIHIKADGPKYLNRIYKQIREGG